MHAEPGCAPARAFLTAQWRAIVMLNFPVDPHVLEPALPRALELDYFHGLTYLSLVGFRFTHLNVYGIRLPGHQAFDEVNLRFYVRRRVGDGYRRGVVFIKEIVPRRLIAFAARTFYNENYVVMPMKSRVNLPAGGAEGALWYEWYYGERWHAVTAKIAGEPVEPVPDSVEEFITEHYWGYTRQKSGCTLEYEVNHPRWRIWQDAKGCFDGDAAQIYPPQFAPFLSVPPCSALVADGSSVIVRKGRLLP